MASAVGHFLLGVAGFVVLCEILFQVLPVSSATKMGLYIDPKIPTYARQHGWRYATGWDLRNPQALETNNFGFVSEHDFVRDEGAVAFVGDSFVESASLNAIDRPGAQLERALSRRRAVYAMGSPGTSLLDYAERIRFAHENFGIRDFVVLVERGDIRQALCGSGNVGSQCLEPQTLAPRTITPANPSPAKRVLRHSAFLQYLMGQLKLDPGALRHKVVGALRSTVTSGVARQVSSTSNDDRDAAVRAMYLVDTVTARFFERVKPYTPGRLVVVVDSDRRALMRGEFIDDPQRRRFIELARAAGALVVDTEPLFRAHFKHSTLSLDLGPSDAHLNKLGVDLVAREAAAMLGPRAL